MDINGMPITYINTDFEDLVKCDTVEDCPNPAETVCPTGQNISMSNICICIQTIKPLEKGKVCSEDILSNVHGVIPLDHVSAKVNHRIPEPQLNKPSDNLTQTTHQFTDEPLSDEALSAALKIFVPLAGVLVLGAIIIFILIRRFRFCRRKKHRQKSSAMIKASEDVGLLDRISVVNKNPVYFGTKLNGDVNMVNGKGVAINNIPIERVKLLDAVGEGAFGQVFKGEMTTTDTEGPKNIAVKVLKDGVSNEARDDFEREVEIMSAFDHDNILKLIGIVASTAGETPYMIFEYMLHGDLAELLYMLYISAAGETPYMIFEYMLHGDLAELLRKTDPSVRGSEPSYPLQKTDLIDISTQISSGMSYLTSQHFVHRDLATRNCLVGDGLIVKISDFGMARDIYTCDYYRIGGSRMLPVRWMSPEAVKWGRFTTESDIWAYGVVLWEVFNYGRQPYYGHSNEEVIRFLDDGILLQRPNECPSTVYHVMLGCWKLDPKERLPFTRIHNHLVEYSKQVSRTAHTSSIDIANEYEIPL